jgi:uncharacterized membrane protein required for colicin V production
MVESVVLDALLLLILMLLLPLGFFRGGMREVCSAAGLLLGLLIADAWAERWGNWIATQIGVRASTSQFIVAVAVLTVVTAIVGYGAGAGFSYRPGPGGRMYGGLISLLTGALFLGAVINFVSRFLTDGDYPTVIENAYLARILSVGFDWVLLGVGLVVVLATIFGMIVRERDADEYEIQVPYQVPAPAIAGPIAQHTLVREATPDKIEPIAPATVPLKERTAAVTVKQVRHWEEPAPPKPSDLATDWHRTWPGGTRGSSLRARTESKGPPRRSESIRPPDEQSSGAHDARIIRDWLANDENSAPPRSTRNPSAPDPDE